MSARWQDPTYARREVEEDSRLTPLGVTLAFLAMLALVFAAVSCDPNPATSLGCADDSCEVAP